jgi:hypothetical protein
LTIIFAVSVTVDQALRDQNPNQDTEIADGLRSMIGSLT